MLDEAGVEAKRTFFTVTTNGCFTRMNIADSEGLNSWRISTF